MNMRDSNFYVLLSLIYLLKWKQSQIFSKWQACNYTCVFITVGAFLKDCSPVLYAASKRTLFLAVGSQFLQVAFHLQSSYEGTRFVQLGEKDLNRGVITALRYLVGTNRKGEGSLFSEVHAERRRVSGYKLQQGKYQLDRRTKFFNKRVIKEP